MLCGGSVESLDKFFHAVQTNTGIYTMNLKFDAFMDEQKNSQQAYGADIAKTCREVTQSA